MKRSSTAAATAATADPGTSQDLFITLRNLLSRHEAALLVVHDDAGHYYANCRNTDAKGKPQFFGAVKASGRKHAFHFMPVYDFPELLVGIRPALKKRMQGKSCFNFDVVDPALLDELRALVDQGVSRYKAAGKL